MRPLLVVEPHSDSAELLMELLGAAGFEVRHYAALEQLNRDLDALHPGLLLLSAGPHDEVDARALIRGAGSRHIPVVLVSSTRPVAWPGAGAVLTKPFEIEELLEAVRRLYAP